MFHHPAFWVTLPSSSLIQPRFCNITVARGALFAAIQTAAGRPAVRKTAPRGKFGELIAEKAPDLSAIALRALQALFMSHKQCLWISIPPRSKDRLVCRLMRHNPRNESLYDA